jgi:hypothetical protein
VAPVHASRAAYSAVIDEKFRFTSENVGRTTDIVALSEIKKHETAQWALTWGFGRTLL